MSKFKLAAIGAIGFVMHEALHFAVIGVVFTAIGVGVASGEGSGGGCDAGGNFLPEILGAVGVAALGASVLLGGAYLLFGRRQR